MLVAFESCKVISTAMFQEVLKEYVGYAGVDGWYGWLCAAGVAICEFNTQRFIICRILVMPSWFVVWATDWTKTQPIFSLGVSVQETQACHEANLTVILEFGQNVQAGIIPV